MDLSSRVQQPLRFFVREEDSAQPRGQHEEPDHGQPRRTPRQYSQHPGLVVTGVLLVRRRKPGLRRHRERHCLAVPRGQPARDYRDHQRPGENPDVGRELTVL